MEFAKEKRGHFLYHLFCPIEIFKYLWFISVYSVLNTLSEYTYFYISKSITLYTFLFLKFSKPFIVSSNRIFEFCDQICSKNLFWSKTKRINITVEFCIVKLVWVPKYTLNKQFWISEPDLCKQGISILKRKKWTPH